VRFISHRDVARAFERAFRIAELPLAFSAGFSPHPKVSFGPALAVGYESDAEYLDLVLTHEVDLPLLASAVTAGLPDGIAVSGYAALSDRAPSLQEGITALTYRVTLDGAAPAAIGAAVANFLDRPEVRVTVTRKGEQRIDDIRPLVLGVIQPEPGERVVFLDVATRPRTPRVADVVAGLRTISTDDSPLEERHVLRTHQWIERGGARYEPLDVDRRSAAPHGAGARALEACA
jgi:radical SAM-linked protein